MSTRSRQLTEHAISRFALNSVRVAHPYFMRLYLLKRAFQNPNSTPSPFIWFYATPERVQNIPGLATYVCLRYGHAPAAEISSCQLSGFFYAGSGRCLLLAVC